MKRPSLAMLGAALFLSAAAVFFSAEALRRDLERELTRFFRVPVRVERWVLLPRRISLDRVSFQMPSSPVPLRIDRLQIDGRFLSLRTWLSLMKRQPFFPLNSLTLTGLHLSLAGVPLQAQGQVFLTADASGFIRSDGWLTIAHPFLRGRIEVTGPLDSPVTLGWIEGVQGRPRHFVGQWNVRRGLLELTQMEIQGGWICAGRWVFSRGGGFSLFGPEGTRLRLRVLPRGNRAGQAVFWIGGEGEVPGQISGEWEVHGGRLTGTVDFFHGAAGGSGWLELRTPSKFASEIVIPGIQLEEVSGLKPLLGSVKLEGQMEGKISLSGRLGAVEHKGSLSLRQGRIGQESVDSASLRFKGKGPILRLEGAILPQPEVLIRVDGKVDLRRLGRPDFFRSVRLNEGDSLVRLAGWQMRLMPGQSGVVVQKMTGGERMRVGMSYRVDDTVPQEPVTRRSWELEYPLGSRESIRYRLEKEEQFLSLEHRKKF